MRETKYTGLILKKQAFLEADEIITIFTKEKGKVRVLAKSVKLVKSKLSGSLQNLFLVEITVAKPSARLPKLIGSRVINSFSSLRENLECLKRTFYAQELVLKFTADEHKNIKLFDLLHEYLKFLDDDKNLNLLNIGLVKFQIEFLRAVGHSISADKNILSSKEVGFSLSKGGFYQSVKKDESAHKALKQFLSLEGNGFNHLLNIKLEETMELARLLFEFIKYHLERDVNSEQFLKNNVL